MRAMRGLLFRPVFRRRWRSCSAVGCSSPAVRDTAAPVAGRARPRCRARPRPAPGAAAVRAAAAADWRRGRRAGHRALREPVLPADHLPLRRLRAAGLPGGQKTTLRGKVFDPAGRVPLYNVLVYVPNAPLDPITTGPSCDRCDTPISGKPIASALTDTKGEFVLDNVPVGTDIPLVIQVGKWRREIKVPRTQACAETVLDDPNLMRLPRNRDEGNIPKIALTTGGADNLECLLRKIGDRRLRVHARVRPRPGQLLRRPAQPGRPADRPRPQTAATKAYAATLNGGAAFTQASTFWDNPDRLRPLRHGHPLLRGRLSIPNEQEHGRPRRAGGLRQQGRPRLRLALAQHLAAGRPRALVRRWPPSATPANLPDNFVGEVDTSFPKGNALADWLVNVGASHDPGQLPIQEGQAHGHRRQPDATPPPGSAAPWAAQPGVQYFTFNTPAGMPADKQCGRVVFTDIHVSGRRHARPALPQRLRDHRAVAPGKGPGVHPLRPLVLRAARRPAAGHPVADPAAVGATRGRPRGALPVLGAFLGAALGDLDQLFGEAEHHVRDLAVGDVRPSTRNRPVTMSSAAASVRGAYFSRTRARKSALRRMRRGLPLGCQPSKKMPRTMQRELGRQLRRLVDRQPVAQGMKARPQGVQPLPGVVGPQRRHHVLDPHDRVLIRPVEKTHVCTLPAEGR